MPRVDAFARLFVAIGILALGQPVLAAGTAPVGLGTASSFAVLAGSPSVANTGPSEVNGDLGVHPGSAVSGFPPGTLNGALNLADAAALQAQSDLDIAYEDAASRTPAAPVSDGGLGGQTLISGVYTAGANTLNLTGTVILDGQNDPDSVWIFQSRSDLVTASLSSVAFINGGQACNVFWQVTTSATIGSGSNFSGTIMALGSITVQRGVTMVGRALARDGFVTLTSVSITRPVCSAEPTPTTSPTAAPTASPTPTSAPASPSHSPSGTPAGSPSATSSRSASRSPSASSNGSRTAAPTGAQAGQVKGSGDVRKGPPAGRTSATATPRAPIRHQTNVVVSPRPTMALVPTGVGPPGETPATGSGLDIPFLILCGVLAVCLLVRVQRRLR